MTSSAATPQPNVNPDTFKWTQKNAVTAILASDSLSGCLAALQSQGVDTGDVSVLEGDAGRATLDVHGSHHGVWSRIVRSLQSLGSGANERQNYDDALAQGKVVIAVPADDVRAPAIAQLLASNGGSRILHFGATDSVEEL